MTDRHLGLPRRRLALPSSRSQSVRNVKRNLEFNKQSVLAAAAAADRLDHLKEVLRKGRNDGNGATRARVAQPAM